MKFIPEVERVKVNLSVQKEKCEDLKLKLTALEQKDKTNLAMILSLQEENRALKSTLSLQEESQKKLQTINSELESWINHVEDTPDNSQVSPKTLVFKHKQKERKQFLSKVPRGPLIIPWQGKILTPSPSQLRIFQGNLDEIASKLGSREPVGKEKFY